MTATPTPSTSAPATPRPKRGWLQFNLRTLLVMTLVVGSGLGWVASERRKNAIIQADIDGLVSFGCEVYGLQVQPTRFDWLLGRKNFRKRILIVTCDGTAITNAGLEHLKDFTNLNKLSLDGTAITDAGLEHLKDLTYLYVLDLSNTAITDAGLKRLKGLTSLSFLSLENTAITDSGLVHLMDLSYLSLDGTAITDAGLEHLKGSAQLGQLELRGTRVTKSGVAELQKALPNCSIIHDAKD